MTDEDRTVLKLKGHNCLIKFKDGEELTLYIDKLDGTDEDIAGWIFEVEKFIAGVTTSPYFPSKTIAVSHESIKYVKPL